MVPLLNPNKYFAVQLGREPLQRTNVEEIVQLLKSHRREQARQEGGGSPKKSQSSPKKQDRTEDGMSEDLEAHDAVRATI